MPIHHVIEVQVAFGWLHYFFPAVGGQTGGDHVDEVVRAGAERLDLGAARGGSAKRLPSGIVMSERSADGFRSVVRSSVRPGGVSRRRWGMITAWAASG